MAGRGRPRRQLSSVGCALVEKAGGQPRKVFACEKMGAGSNKNREKQLQILLAPLKHATLNSSLKYWNKAPFKLNLTSSP